MFKSRACHMFMKEAYASVIVLQLAILLGIIFGYSAYLFVQWKTDESVGFLITSGTESFIGTTSVCLRPVGAFVDTFAIDMLGRRGTVRITFLFLAIGWLLTGLAPTLELFIAGRILNSIFTGTFVSSSLYISETSSNERRATFLSLLSPMVTLGTTVTYVMMITFRWKTCALIIAVYCFVCFGLSYTIPETAYWYTMKDRHQEAAATLRWFAAANDDNNSDNERKLNEIKQSSSATAHPSISVKWRTFRQHPGMISRFFVMLILLNLLQWTGYQVIQNYAVDFFGSLRSGYAPEAVSVVFGLLCFSCDVILICIVGKFKRKSLMIWSGLGMIVCMTITLGLQALTTAVGSSGKQTESSVNGICRKISLFTTLAYAAFSHLGFNEVIFIVIPELFPTVIRATVFATLCIVYYASMVAIFYLYPIIMSHFGFIYMSAIFEFCTILSIVLTAFYIPETQNISLHQI